MSSPALKILHILDHSLPLHSGYTFRSRNILRSQIKRGWTPIVITSPKHEANWKGAWAPVESINGVTHYRTGASRGSKLPLVSERRLMAALERRIRDVVIQERPDLIHAHSSILNGIPALRVARSLGLPLVYEVRAFWEDAAVDHGSYAENSWKYRLVRLLETRVCRKAVQVAVLCEGVRQDLVERGISADKLTIVYNGVNPEDFQLGEPDSGYERDWGTSGKKVIGFVGSFYRYEGLDLLIKAFAGLLSTRNDLLLLLVGGGEMEEEIRKQIVQLGIQSSVVLPGRIPHDRVPSVYSMMDVLVYPRYSMRLTELVTPLKPLEAMSMGRALVASDIGGHRELIQHGQTGLLFPAGDAAALQTVLSKILDSGELRKALEQRGHFWVHQNHTWEKTTSVYSAVYEKALKASTSPLRSVVSAS